MGISRRFKLFLGIIIPLFGFFLMSHNTSAVSLGTSSFEFYGSDSYNSSYYWTTGVRYNSKFSRHSLKSYNIVFDSISSTGNNASIHFETNIVGQSFNRDYFTFQYGNSLRVSGCALRPSYTALRLLSQSISFAETDWTGSSGEQNTTLTIYGDVALGNIPNNSSVQIFCTIDTANGQPFFTGTNYANTPTFYFERNPSTILFTSDPNEATNQALINQNNQIISQNQNMINQNSQIINNQNEQMQREQQSIDNIEGQSSSDISNSSDQQTSNLIGIITGFISTITGYGTGNSCVISLPFPEFAGGTQTVNVCNDRDKLAMNNLNYVMIFANLAMVCFFVPICFILLRMIYKEIRSWTNG